MSQQQSLYQSLAASGATLIAFVGVCHEFIGHIVFPWAPAFVGGPIVWHSLGLFTIIFGLLLLAGTLRLIKFPVIRLSLVAAAIGIGLVVVTATLHHQFHMPALAVALSGFVTAFCHRKAAQQGAPAERLASASVQQAAAELGR